MHTGAMSEWPGLHGATCLTDLNGLLVCNPRVSWGGTSFSLTFVFYKHSHKLGSPPGECFFANSAVPRPISSVSLFPKHLLRLCALLLTKSALFKKLTNSRCISLKHLVAFNSLFLLYTSEKGVLPVSQWEV